MRGFNKVYWLKKEIEQITEQIKELTLYSSPSFSGNPSGCRSNASPVELYVIKKERLMEKLHKKIKELFEEMLRMEKFIEGIKDVEIRLIARKRFIENKDWQVIGDEMYMDRTTVSRKLKKYLERETKCN